MTGTGSYRIVVGRETLIRAIVALDQLADEWMRIYRSVPVGSATGATALQNQAAYRNAAEEIRLAMKDADLA